MDVTFIEGLKIKLLLEVVEVFFFLAPNEELIFRTFRTHPFFFISEAVAWANYGNSVLHGLGFKLEENILWTSNEISVFLILFKRIHINEQRALKTMMLSSFNRQRNLFSTHPVILFASYHLCYHLHRFLSPLATSFTGLSKLRNSNRPTTLGWSQPRRQQPAGASLSFVTSASNLPSAVRTNACCSSS